MNKHIELVKKWLADPSSKTQEELDANYASADAYAVNMATSSTATLVAVDTCQVRTVAVAMFAAYWAADRAADTAYWAAYWAMKDDIERATKYVKRYEELVK